MPPPEGALCPTVQNVHVYLHPWLAIACTGFSLQTCEKKAMAAMRKAIWHAFQCTPFVVSLMGLSGVE